MGRFKEMKYEDDHRIDMILEESSAVNMRSEVVKLATEYIVENPYISEAESYELAYQELIGGKS